MARKNLAQKSLDLKLWILIHYATKKAAGYAGLLILRIVEDFTALWSYCLIRVSRSWDRDGVVWDYCDWPDHLLTTLSRVKGNRLWQPRQPRFLR